MFDQLNFSASVVFYWDWVVGVLTPPTPMEPSWLWLLVTTILFGTYIESLAVVGLNKESDVISLNTTLSSWPKGPRNMHVFYLFLNTFNCQIL